MSDNSIDALYDELTLDRQIRPADAPPAPWRENIQWAYSIWGTLLNVKNKNKFDIIYYNPSGEIHRISGPAYTSGHYNCVMWFKHGRPHRIGGAAMIYNKNETWYENGLLHRLDGPAVISSSGPKEFWIDGQKYSTKQYKWEIARRKRKGLII
jgi:hypothetical protein